MTKKKIKGQIRQNGDKNTGKKKRKRNAKRIYKTKGATASLKSMQQQTWKKTRQAILGGKKKISKRFTED